MDLNSALLVPLSTEIIIPIFLLGTVDISYCIAMCLNVPPKSNCLSDLATCKVGLLTVGSYMKKVRFSKYQLNLRRNFVHILTGYSSHFRAQKIERISTNIDTLKRMAISLHSRCLDKYPIDPHNDTNLNSSFGLEKYTYTYHQCVSSR